MCNKCDQGCLSQSVGATIPAGGALSGAIAAGNFTSGTLHMPSTWTAADIGFQVSDSLHGTYQPLLDGNGNRIEITVSAGGSYVIPAAVMNSAFVKLWSQSGGAAVNQAEGRVFVLDLTNCGSDTVAWGEITGTLSNQTDLQGALDALLPRDAEIVAVATARNLQSSDAGKILECDGTFTLTAPNGLDGGFQCAIVNVGTGTITLAATTTFQGKGTALAEQYGAATIYHRGSNVWLAFGDLS